MSNSLIFAFLCLCYFFSILVNVTALNKFTVLSGWYIRVKNSNLIVVPALVQQIKNPTAAAWVSTETWVQSPAWHSGLENLPLLQLWLIQSLAWDFLLRKPPGTNPASYPSSLPPLSLRFVSHQRLLSNQDAVLAPKFHCGKQAHGLFFPQDVRTREQRGVNTNSKGRETYSGICYYYVSSIQCPF